MRKSRDLQRETAGNAVFNREVCNRSAKLCCTIAQDVGGKSGSRGRVLEIHAFAGTLNLLVLKELRCVSKESCLSMRVFVGNEPSGHAGMSIWRLPRKPEMDFFGDTVLADF